MRRRETPSRKKPGSWLERNNSDSHSTVARFITIGMNTISISRRRFAQLLGIGAAAAVVKPAFSFATESITQPATTSVVRLSSNENPYGPSPKALKAMNDAFDLSCRYPDEHV